LARTLPLNALWQNLLFFIRSGRLSIDKYRHAAKNARNEDSRPQEDLERCANVWATEFVQANLRSHLASWLRELDSLFPEELPFGTSRVGRSYFTAMVITKNYHSTPHTDRDLSNSVISWFLEGKCSFPHASVFLRPKFSKKNNCKTPSLQHNCELGCWSRIWEVRSGGQFAFPTHQMFFQPRHGTVILFWSTWLQHCTIPIQD
jgi:hypothetical protein